MSFLRAVPLLLLPGVLLAQTPDPYPNGTPPTSGSPGSRPGQVPQGGSGMPKPPLGHRKNGRGVPAKPILTVPTASAPGLLVSISESKTVVLADDKRVIRYVTSPAAKFYRMEGEERKEVGIIDLHKGDRVMIDYATDEDGETYAIQITTQKPVTPEDAKRVAAVDEALIQPRLEPVPGGEPEKEDRPRIRRKDGTQSPDAKEPSTATGAPAAGSAPAPSPAARAPQETVDDNGPQQPATVVVKNETTRDKGDDEFGHAPVLKRGKPVQRASVTPPSSGAPPAPPARSEGSAPQPAAPAKAAAPAAKGGEWKEDPSVIGAGKTEHPALQGAREAVQTLTESMPNYICQQITTRYQSTNRHKPDWRALDIISAEVVVENGRERYRNLQVNFKPTKKTLDELGGSRSTGEFFTMLIDLFNPSSAADFRYSHPETIANRLAYVFRFSVDQPHSHWTVHSPSQSYRPAYKGSIWIDKETSRILRIETQATKIPSDFTYDIMEATVDYDFVKIGARDYIVPVKAENLSCMASNGYCARNQLEFRNYRKFAAESEILPTSEK